MSPMLACPGPEEPTGPDRDGSSPGSSSGSGGLDGHVDGFDGDPLGSFDVLFEGDDLLEALAHASGIYGTNPNGHRDLCALADAAGANGSSANPPGPPSPPTSPGSSPDGDDPSGDDPSDNGHGSGGSRRCPHGQPLLTSADLTGWWGPPQPGEPAYWCPLWCSRIDRDGHEVDPADWVHRSLPHQLEIEAGGLTTGPDGEEVTGPAVVTVRAEKHPRKPVRFILALAVAGVQHTCTMTLPETQYLRGFQDTILDDLAERHLAA